MTPLETEANPNIRVGPLRWGRPESVFENRGCTQETRIKFPRLMLVKNPENRSDGRKFLHRFRSSCFCISIGIAKQTCVRLAS